MNERKQDKATKDLTEIAELERKHNVRGISFTTNVSNVTNRQCVGYVKEMIKRCAHILKKHGKE